MNESFSPFRDNDRSLFVIIVFLALRKIIFRNKRHMPRHSRQKRRQRKM